MQINKLDTTACIQYCLAEAVTQGYDRLHTNRKITKPHSNHFKWGFFLIVFATSQIVSLPFLKPT
jgi:hypothetical protein